MVLVVACIKFTFQKIVLGWAECLTTTIATTIIIGPRGTSFGSLIVCSYDLWQNTVFSE